MAKKKAARNTSIVKAKRRGSAAAKPAKPRPKASAKGAAKRKPTVKAAPRLPRPKITGEEKLYLLFKEDYHARQVFDFLRVETVKELEQFSPGQIIQRLSQPILGTVEMIRRKLADYNRCLAGDERFLLGSKGE